MQVSSGRGEKPASEIQYPLRTSIQRQVALVPSKEEKQSVFGEDFPFLNQEVSNSAHWDSPVAQGLLCPPGVLSSTLFGKVPVCKL